MKIKIMKIMKKNIQAIFAIALMIAVTACVGSAVQAGDTVKINWIARDSTGKVIDTNIREVAVENGLELRDENFYQPSEIVVGSGEVVLGVDEALVGAKPGKTVEITVLPEKGYRNLEETIPIEKVQTIPIEEKMSVEEFEQKMGIENPEVGLFGLTGVPHYLGGWDSTITNVTDTEVTLRNRVLQPILPLIPLPPPWEVFPGWTAKITGVDAEYITVEHTPEVGFKFRGNPNGFPWLDSYEYTVKEITEDSIILSYNLWEAIANEELTFEINIVEVVKPK